MRLCAVFAAAALLLLISSALAFGQNPPGIVMGKAKLWTGTNAGIFAIIVPGTYPLESEEIQVNGTEVLYVALPTLPYISVTIDSTHFGDGSQVSFTVSATDTKLTTTTVTQSVAIYNEAEILGNQNPPTGIGSLFWGQAAAGNVAAGADGYNYRDVLGGGSLQQTKPDILAQIPVTTVFYAYTHGSPDSIGDDAAGTIDGEWMDVMDITRAIAEKPAVHAPGYSFVFPDACECGASAQLANAFGIAGPDSAFLGWPVDVQDTQPNSAWSQFLFQQLDAGSTLATALTNLAKAGHQGETGADGVQVAPQKYGDGGFKLTGVYGEEGTAWYQ